MIHLNWNGIDVLTQYIVDCWEKIYNHEYYDIILSVKSIFYLKPRLYYGLSSVLASRSIFFEELFTWGHDFKYPEDNTFKLIDIPLNFEAYELLFNYLRTQTFAGMDVKTERDWDSSIENYLSLFLFMD